MKKIEKINAREKEVYKLLIATFIAKRISINYKYYKNKGIKTYNSIYISSFDTFNINDKDKQDIFNEAEVILEQQEKLIFAHYDADKPLYMVKL
jgi:hypothetical protein